MTGPAAKSSQPTSNWHAFYPSRLKREVGAHAGHFSVLAWGNLGAEMEEDINKPATWPGGVKEITWNDLSRLGVGPDNFLYWDGNRLQTETKLGTFERGLATTVALSSIVLAVIEVARFFGFGQG